MLHLRRRFGTSRAAHIVVANGDRRGDRMKSVKARRNAGAPALEWLCDLSGRTARVTSIGNRSLLVENHCGILEFTSERIALASRCGDIEVEGSELSLAEVRRDALLIRGSIRSVKLPCWEAERHES